MPNVATIKSVMLACVLLVLKVKLDTIASMMQTAPTTRSARTQSAWRVGMLHGCRTTEHAPANLVTAPRTIGTRIQLANTSKLCQFGYSSKFFVVFLPICWTIDKYDSRV
jgi:hypothetical protein